MPFFGMPPIHQLVRFYELSLSLLLILHQRHNITSAHKMLSLLKLRLLTLFNRNKYNNNHSRVRDAVFSALIPWLVYGVLHPLAAT